MGRIWTRRIEVVGTLSEIAGHKSGLALTRSDLVEHLPEYRDILVGEDENTITLRAESYEELTTTLLYRIGNIATPQVLFPGLRLFHKYKTDPLKLELLTRVISVFNNKSSQYINDAARKRGRLDPNPFIKECKKEHGLEGALIALEFIDDLAIYQHVSPWSSVRRFEWRDTKELADLFHGESLQTFYGSFFDQRFIDYLDRNFESIDKINWRKFEGLVSEFFARNGFYVEIGKGRGDDGIDVRVWPKKEQKDAPSTILIQCKREKKKIQKVVVKALWADIVESKAKSGLIVTTSSLSPGAKKVCVARSYPISQVDREKLRAWLKTMRSPNTGVFLGG